MTDSVMQEALRLRAENRSLREISEQVGVSITVISRNFSALRDVGVPVPRRQLGSAYHKIRQDVAAGRVVGGQLSIRSVFIGASQSDYEAFLRDHVRRGESLADAVVRVVREKIDGLG
jgi:biotin operon repressor